MLRRFRLFPFATGGDPAQCSAPDSVHMSNQASKMSEGLIAVVDRVWGSSSDASSPVAVSLQTAPEDHVVVETYAIVPGLHRARFLVPTGSRRAAVASMWAYHTMRAPQRRAAEAAVAALFGSSLDGRVFPSRLVVSIDRRVPDGDYARWLFLSHLEQQLGGGRLFAGMAVRRVQPNAKPLLEVFDAEGTPRGYAKLGWSAATKHLVRTEADALDALTGRLDRVTVPRLLASGDWNDTGYSVASPLPRGLRRYSSDPVSAPGVVLEVAKSAPVTRSALADSSYARGLHEALAASMDGAREESRVLDAWLSRLELDPSPLRFGRWHGDWTPHNLGHADGRVAAWDWEHSRAGVPVGFDSLHWHFQRRLSHADVSAAVSEVAIRSAELGSLGVSSGGLVGSLYLLEMFVRTVRLAVGGGGWNTRVYPKMLDIAAQMDR